MYSVYDNSQLNDVADKLHKAIISINKTVKGIRNNTKVVDDNTRVDFDKLLEYIEKHLHGYKFGECFSINGDDNHLNCEVITKDGEVCCCSVFFKYRFDGSCLIYLGNFDGKGLSNYPIYEVDKIPYARVVQCTSYDRTFDHIRRVYNASKLVDAQNKLDDIFKCIDKDLIANRHGNLDYCKFRNHIVALLDGFILGKNLGKKNMYCACDSFSYELICVKDKEEQQLCGRICFGYDRDENDAYVNLTTIDDEIIDGTKVYSIFNNCSMEYLIKGSREDGKPYFEWKKQYKL